MSVGCITQTVPVQCVIKFLGIPVYLIYILHYLIYLYTEILQRLSKDNLLYHIIHKLVDITPPASNLRPISSDICGHPLKYIQLPTSTDAYKHSLFTISN